MEEERSISEIPIKHRYGIFPATIIGDKRLKAGQLRCLMSILAWRSSRTTNTRPIHLEALQLMMPMYTKGSIQNYMQDLKAYGYIEITPRPGTTSMYTICDKADAHAQYEEHRGELVESSAADQLVSNAASVKNNNNKKNSRFMAVWSAYPEHRRNTIARDSKTWREFGDEALVDIIVEDLEARKETEAWRDEDGKWVPGLRKYLENRTWEKSPIKKSDGFWKNL